MLTVLIRSVLLYTAAVVALRVMGKRQVGQLQPFELVVVIMIAELAATPMGSVGIPLLYGLVPIAALVMCHGMITWLSMRYPPFAKVISGEPTVLIRGGAICESALRQTGIALSDLMEAVRIGGQLDIAQVETAVLEPSGRISVFPKPRARSVTPGDLGLRVESEALPLPLILDGKVHTGNLEDAGMTMAQLRAILAAMGLGAVGDVLLLSRSCDGSYFGQKRGQQKTVIMKK